MKDLLLRTVVAVVICISAVPAAARGGWNVGAAAAVGVLGGMALGGALAAPRPVYVVPRRVYVGPAEECYVERERVFVPGWGWELRRRTICY